MRKTSFLLLTALGFTALQAQTKEGTVTYERKINMHRMVQDEQMRAMLPEYRTSRHMLLFSDSISLYKTIPEDEAPDPFAGGGGRVMMRFGGSDGSVLYKNFGQAKSIRSEELAGKNFLIVDSIKQQPWKLTSETKQILGHTCVKATLKTTMGASVARRSVTIGGAAPQNDTTAVTAPKSREIEVVAWFAQDMNSPVGPETYGQLPGVILELNMDNGATVYTATEIKKNADPKELKEPKKGKLVTSNEFNKMRMDMIQNQMPVGGVGSFRVGG